LRAVDVDDPALARAYLDEFERVYAQAQEPIWSWLAFVIVVSRCFYR
jgi:hypothetical protein